MPSSLESTLEAAILTRTPMILWGPPGVGKTALVHAVARRLALPVETRSHSQACPTSRKGRLMGRLKVTPLADVATPVRTTGPGVHPK